MEREIGYKSLNDFLNSDEDMKLKIIRLKRSSNHFMKKMDGIERTKFWLALIPEAFSDKARTFYRLVKVKNSVKVFTRHKLIVDYDTLYLAKQINESNRDDYILITNARLSLMRSIICLFLAFSRESEYDRGWSHISYALVSLGATEEDTFVIFSHLVMNILPGFFNAADNSTEKVKLISEFYFLAERQRYSFANMNHTSIFKSANKINSITLDYNEYKSKSALFHHESIGNVGLFILVKALCNEWLGALFSNVLYPKECLMLWDNLLIHNFRWLFRFGISFINKNNTKLEHIIKKERKNFSEIGIEAPQHHFLLIAPMLKKHLTTVLQPSEFLSIMAGVTDKRDSTMIMTPDKKASYIAQDITISLFNARLRYYFELKRELETSIPLDTGRVLTIFQIIDDFKTDKITSKDFVTLMTTNQVSNAGHAVKIFTMIDQNLKGKISKKEAKNFFSIIADTLDRKIKIFWRENTKGPLIEANEGLELLQLLDATINPDSTLFNENLSIVYDRLVRKIAEPNISVESFTNFIKKEKICSTLFKQLNVIDGKEPDEGVMPSETDEDEVERTDSKFDKFNRSHRFSSPTYGELSSKGRVSISRKSAFNFGFEIERIERERSNKDELMSEDGTNTVVQVKYDETPKPDIAFIGGGGDGGSIILNTEENLPEIQPPTFMIRSPIMSSKYKQKSM